MNYIELPDDILLRLLKANDEQAFTEIFERHWKPVYEHARNKVDNTDTAKDIVQAIFISIWEQRHTLAIQQLRAYLHISVKNRVINHYRQKIQPQKYAEEKSTIESGHSNETYNTLQFNELYFQFLQSLNDLPQKTREIFTLSRIENLPVKAIAAEMNLSEKAVEYHITTSLKRLRAVLKEFLPCFILF